MASNSKSRAGLAAAALTAVITVAAESSASAGGYSVTSLVTDDPAVLATTGYGPAATVDPNLVDPWGFDHSATGPWVVANAFGTGTASIYDGSGHIVYPSITTPQDGSVGPAGPTGVVYVGGAGFASPGGYSAQYATSNLDGSIAIWDGRSSSAQVVVPGLAAGNNAIYTGLAVGSVGSESYLYAANVLTGSVDVYDQSYASASLAGAFVDPGPNPDGLSPFNVQALDGHLWVTYAVPGPNADEQALGSGFVSEFNTDGTFVRRFADGGTLSSPWGIAVAPSDFGRYSNDILIGNFNNDTPDEAFIGAYDPSTGAFLGELSENGSPILLGGLWGLEFGNGGAAGPTNRLYFVAGINDENDGLFGSISAVPEPATWTIMIGGLGAIGAVVRRRRTTLSSTAPAV